MSTEGIEVNVDNSSKLFQNVLSENNLLDEPQRLYFKGRSGIQDFRMDGRLPGSRCGE